MGFFEFGEKAYQQLKAMKSVGAVFSALSESNT
jgi:hypothetical protein